MGSPDQKLGRNQRAILELMFAHRGIYPYADLHRDRLILRSLERRGLVQKHPDHTWRVVLSRR